MGILLKYTSLDFCHLFVALAGVFENLFRSLKMGHVGNSNASKTREAASSRVPLLSGKTLFFSSFVTFVPFREFGDYMGFGGPLTDEELWQVTSPYHLCGVVTFKTQTW